MKTHWANGRLVVRFTLNFIAHQILLFLTVSLPAVFYIVVLNRPEKLFAVNATTWMIFIAYGLYCLFYGYYVARPMADILAKIRQLSCGEYPAFGERGRSFPFSSRLYRECTPTLNLCRRSCGKTNGNGGSSSRRGRTGHRASPTI
ncbi:hypothetical protein [Saccharibacillus alkalitolerans]|uniref:hypothetical protein n=1 Tax=Saccharibacillus alkalitolerans TaxID=2705290 RepID=UPI00197E21DA|nr:hypothetical protein [Saccharibacillus alkalitolerans]